MNRNLRSSARCVYSRIGELIVCCCSNRNLWVERNSLTKLSTVRHLLQREESVRQHFTVNQSCIEGIAADSNFSDNDHLNFVDEKCVDSTASETT